MTNIQLDSKKLIEEKHSGKHLLTYTALYNS